MVDSIATANNPKLKRKLLDLAVWTSTNHEDLLPAPENCCWPLHDVIGRKTGWRGTYDSLEDNAVIPTDEKVHFVCVKTHEYTLHHVSKKEKKAEFQKRGVQFKIKEDAKGTQLIPTQCVDAVPLVAPTFWISMCGRYLLWPAQIKVKGGVERFGPVYEDDWGKVKHFIEAFSPKIAPGDWKEYIIADFPLGKRISNKRSLLWKYMRAILAIREVSSTSAQDDVCDFDADRIKKDEFGNIIKPVILRKKRPKSKVRLEIDTTSDEENDEEPAPRRELLGISSLVPRKNNLSADLNFNGTDKFSYDLPSRHSSSSSSESSDTEANPTPPKESPQPVPSKRAAQSVQNKPEEHAGTQHTSTRVDDETLTGNSSVGGMGQAPDAASIIARKSAPQNSSMSKGGASSITPDQALLAQFLRRAGSLTTRQLTLESSVPSAYESSKPFEAMSTDELLMQAKLLKHENDHLRQLHAQNNFGAHLMYGLGFLVKQSLPECTVEAPPLMPEVEQFRPLIPFTNYRDCRLFDHALKGQDFFLNALAHYTFKAFEALKTDRKIHLALHTVFFTEQFDRNVRFGERESKQNAEKRHKDNNFKEDEEQMTDLDKPEKRTKEKVTIEGIERTVKKKIKRRIWVRKHWGKLGRFCTLLKEVASGILRNYTQQLKDNNISTDGWNWEHIKGYSKLKRNKVKSRENAPPKAKKPKRDESAAVSISSSSASSTDAEEELA